MKEYSIYQLRNEAQNRDFQFRSYESIIKDGLSVEPARYQAVYRAAFDEKMSLSDLYTKFNMELPGDFHGHSLSVGDVIVVSDRSSSEAFFVDSFGFKEIPEFIRDLPIYRHSAAYAREAGELNDFRTSHAENVRCKNAIDDIIAANFDGMFLKPDAAALAIDQYGAERVSMVLANTLMLKDYDGRFSRSNKQWAQTIDVPIDRSSFGDMRNHEYQLTSHPAVLDGFVNQTRRALEKQKTVTLSIHARQEKDAPAQRPSLRETLRSKQEKVQGRQAKPVQAETHKDRDGLE